MTDENLKEGWLQDVTRRVNSTKDTPLSGQVHDDDGELGSRAMGEGC